MKLGEKVWHPIDGTPIQRKVMRLFTRSRNIALDPEDVEELREEAAEFARIADHGVDLRRLDAWGINRARLIRNLLASGQEQSDALHIPSFAMSHTRALVWFLGELPRAIFVTDDPEQVHLIYEAGVTVELFVNRREELIVTWKEGFRKEGSMSFESISASTRPISELVLDLLWAGDFTRCY